MPIQNSTIPLAHRVRPDTFEEFVGQEEIIGKGSLLRKAIEKDQIPSLILWGPPGCGKTALANVIAHQTKSYFVPISAVTSGVADLKKLVKAAKDRSRAFNQKTIIFIDEIHRFNKAQQDYLLPHIEDGTIIFIGATTENPSFEVISPLLSRSRVFVLEPLTEGQLKLILERALKDKNKGLGRYKVKLDKGALDHLIDIAGGDARVALNGLEQAILGAKPGKDDLLRKIDIKTIEDALQKRTLQYDKGGEEHYNVISAFIKSMRGSDPDAALYWLARMVEAGENPRFIARRIVIFASEDIGNADPFALSIATQAAQAVEFVGMPEAEINLAHAVTYLASCPKSNSSYQALLRAKQEVKKTGAKPVPLHIRNAPTPLMKDLGYGKDYKYPHEYPGHFVKDEKYLPKGVKGGYFKPGNQGFEKKIKEWLKK